MIGIVIVGIGIFNDVNDREIFIVSVSDVVNDIKVFNSESNNYIINIFLVSIIFGGVVCVDFIVVFNIIDVWFV